ncbi:MAG: LamG domain-containing protein [Planctomycetota bacterium]|nr:LamG domain-containing protein [Planctomycetota bacterium]
MRTVVLGLAACIPLSVLALTLAAAEKPAAWWKLDAGSAREAPSPWSADGKVGGALAFSGGACVKVPEIGTFDALTIALWVRPEALDQALSVLLACEGWDRSMVHFQFARDGRAEFSVNGSDPVDAYSTAAPGKNLGAWRHVAAAYDSRAKKVRFYVNGKLDREFGYASAIPAKLSALRLGAWDKEPRLFTGKLDDVRLYSRALDAAALAKVAAGEELKDGLEAWWRMGEKEGTRVADASGKGRDGVLVGAGGAGATAESLSGAEDEIHGRFAFVPGVAGKAMRLDGGTTVVHKAAKAPKMNPEGFSMEAWVALASPPRGPCVLVQQEQARRGYVFGVSGQGRLSLQFALGQEWKEGVSLNRLPLRKWAHVAATYSPDNGINVYINGRHEGNLVLLGPVWFAEDADLVIGRSLDGLLDDLVIHNAELGPKEVLKHYEAGKSAADPALAP